MKYMGSKARIAKYILPIILKNRKPNQLYVEPFCGGCNMIDKVSSPRIANDSNQYLISMWKALQDKWEPPIEISRDDYNIAREAMRGSYKNFPNYLIGYIGFNCSYSGKFFGGYAGKTKTKLGTIRDYQLEAYKNIHKQIRKLNDVTFECLEYYKLELNNCIVYCDPPYKGTTKYNNDFNHEEFWQYVRDMSVNNEVYVSEYNAPDDFECLWSMEVNSSLSANGKIGGNKKSVEKLFKLRSKTNEKLKS
jgi:DNA adenine methylase